MSTDNLEERVMSLVESMVTGVAEVATGPGAEAAMLYYMAEGFHKLGWSLLAASIVVIALFTYRHGMARLTYFETEFKDKRLNGSQEAQFIIPFIASGVLALVGCAATLLNFNPMGWLQVLYPQIGMVRDVLEALK